MADQTPNTPDPEQELEDYTGRYVIEFSGTRVLPEGTTEEEASAIGEAFSEQFSENQDQYISVQVIGGQIQDNEKFLMALAFQEVERAIARGDLSALGIPAEEDAQVVKVPGMNLGGFSV